MAITKEEIKRKFFLDSRSPLFTSAMRDCELVAQSSANVLLTGQSGTGKDVAAQYIHACSNRSEGPFVAINCSSYPSTLLESELFGHTKGAFTGADKNKTGKFEIANNGTLFLDEIGDIPVTTQTELLRTLETKTIEPLGAETHRSVNFRLITATNKDIKASISGGLFREDFFYRISTIVIRLPSVKERQEDIPDLLKFFIEKAEKKYGKAIKKTDEEVKRFLMEYDYPGNLREMKNIAERMVILSENGIINKRGLPILYGFGREVREDNSERKIVPWNTFKRQSEKEYISFVLSSCSGNVKKAAELLKITPRSIYNKIAEFDLK